MAKAGKGLLEGTLQAGTSAVSDKLLDLVGLGGKSAADKGKDTRDYLAAAFPELNAWERAGADASSAGMVDEIGRAVQQECRDRARMPSSACKKKQVHQRTEQLAIVRRTRVLEISHLQRYRQHILQRI